MIEVVAAIIELEGKLLAFQRGPSKYSYISHKFEFPGGKIEPGENQRLALARELKEELNLANVEIDDFVMSVEHSYPDFEIIMHCFLVNLKMFDNTLTEHINYAHVTLGDADFLDWIEADRPILEILRRDYSHVFTE